MRQELLLYNIWLGAEHSDAIHRTLADDSGLDDLVRLVLLLQLLDHRILNV